MSFIHQFRTRMRKARIRIALPFISYEATLGELADSRSLDARIAQLERVKEDLIGAISAVDELQKKAMESKKEYIELEDYK